ncbi:hypothetical protein [Brucella sp. NBRC 12950]|uniref:hypothetical protein n=1 Tax=Brucella sp. NBRC 12950 TaxID=2994518 RepID=UPI0024A596C2|nr:hypothetical protein [Brucella sp. NBRC 12950]GLU28950.1 hypothetical protein Brsp01_41830 [Brucella sp. NBRC 12950]
MQISKSCGKDKPVKRSAVTSDADTSLLRIAVYQIMANCFPNEMRIHDFRAICLDMMNSFEASKDHVVWGVAAKTDFARQGAFMKSKAAGRTKQYFKAAT